jgi:rhodanese-related sulfurtransferase
MHSAPGVDTLGELELLDFLVRDVRAGSGLLLDARLPEEFQVETIPSAVNIPFSVVRQDNPHLRDILLALGARWTGAQWDFGAARSLLVFCAGAWSGDAAQAIRAMLSMGYPASKLKYYRGGMQSWRSLGLTTVVTGPGR